MTKPIPLEDAAADLAALIARAEAGEEIVITRDGKPIARLLAAAPLGETRERVFGRFRHWGEIPEDVFAPDPEDARYAEQSIEDDLKL